jgi:hypothetical protein
MEAMSRPVKLSETLVLDARLAAEAQQRSIAGQVEFWARLGRVLELTLDGSQVLAISRASGSKSLAEMLGAVDTPNGREVFSRFLEGEPFPHYEIYEKDRSLLVRWQRDGDDLIRTVGRFVNRTFEVVGEELDEGLEMGARRFIGAYREGRGKPSLPIGLVSARARRKGSRAIDAASNSAALEGSQDRSKSDTARGRS